MARESQRYLSHRAGAHEYKTSPHRIDDTATPNPYVIPREAAVGEDAHVCKFYDTIASLQVAEGGMEDMY